MEPIYKIKLPNGAVYEIEDRYARQILSGGLQFAICWDGNGEPVVANIPAGVKITYQETEYTGTKSANTAEPLTFYLVYSPTQVGEGDHYDEYVAIGDVGEKRWEKIGDTRLNLSDLGDLAYRDNVILNKGEGAQVLGANTSFANSNSAVSFAPHTTKKVAGADTTFRGTVTPSVSSIGVVLKRNGVVSVTSRDTVIKSYPGVTKKLEKSAVTGVASKSDVQIPNVTGNQSVNIPNVTSVGAASDWSFAMGTGADEGVLIISGGNGSAPTLGTPIQASRVSLGTPIDASLITTENKEFATGAVADNGGGDAVMTGLGTPSYAYPAKDVSLEVQPTYGLQKGVSTGDGVIELVDGISSVAVEFDVLDEVIALTQLGAATAAAQTITVTKDEKRVALYNDLSVSVS